MRVSPHSQTSGCDTVLCCGAEEGGASSPNIGVVSIKIVKDVAAGDEELLHSKEVSTLEA